MARSLDQIKAVLQWLWGEGRGLGSSLLLEAWTLTARSPASASKGFGDLVLLRQGLALPLLEAPSKALKGTKLLGNCHTGGARPRERAVALLSLKHSRTESALSSKSHVPLNGMTMRDSAQKKRWIESTHGAEAPHWS